MERTIEPPVKTRPKRGPYAQKHRDAIREGMLQKARPFSDEHRARIRASQIAPRGTAQWEFEFEYWMQKIALKRAEAAAVENPLGQ